MNYNFLHAKPKPILSFFSVLWLSFIGFGVFLVICTAIYFYFSTNGIKNNIDKLNMNLENIKNNIIETKNKIMTLQGQKILYDDIYSSNTLCYKSIKNLFDLVPDSIVLNEVYMDKTSLGIKGSTPTKEVFNTLLQTPLKSIFTVSNTSFYQLENGYYNFTSINMLEENEGFNE